MSGWQRAAAIALFVTILLSVLVGGHLYLAQRLVLDLALAPGLERWLLVGLVALGASLVLQPIGERVLSPPWSRLLAWPASLWLGVAFLLLLTVAVSDVALWLVGTPAFAAVGGAPDAVGDARVRAGAALALVAVATVAGLVTALRPPRVRRVEVALERWPRACDGFRIVQISDLHVGPILGRAFAAEVTRRVNALAPDLVAVTGDLVDGSVARLREEVAPFAGLRARHGAFFVTGNHDYFSDADPWVERVRELGMRVLRNERVAIGSGDAAFDLAGVEDRTASFVSKTWREDVPAALAGRDPSRAVVLLAHDPGTFRRAHAHGVDLQLSGHTHGGQIWPFVYFVRLVVPWVAGLYHQGASTLYVSRGTGFWGPPLRLFAPAEITELVLRAPPTAA